MLASLGDVTGPHSLFLGLPALGQLPQLGPYESLELMPSGSPTSGHNGVDGEARRGRDGTTSSSGQAGVRAQKSPKECQTAQKRFRARQKERMSCLEREVAEKKATFEQLAAENILLRARTNILEKVVSCRDEQLRVVQALEDRCRTSPDAQSCFGSGTPNTVASGSQDSQDAIRKMKKEQVVPQYKAFLAEVSGLLLHCKYPCCDPASPVVQQVTSCVERMGGMMKQVILLNPPLFRQLLSINLETLQPAAALDAHWDGVVGSVQLGAEQRSDILAVLDLYHGLLAKVYEERKLIMEALGSGPGTLEPSCTTLTARNLASDMDLTERLDANLVKEHSASTLLTCFFFGKVLAPAQFAKVAVYSYPFFPDCLAIANAVARQHDLVRHVPSGTHSGSDSRGSLDSRRNSR